MARFTNVYAVLADLSDRGNSSPDLSNESTAPSINNNPPSAPLRSEATPNELTDPAFEDSSVASKGE